MHILLSDAPFDLPFDPEERPVRARSLGSYTRPFSGVPSFSLAEALEETSLSSLSAEEIYERVCQTADAYLAQGKAALVPGLLSAALSALKDTVLPPASLAQLEARSRLAEKGSVFDAAGRPAARIFWQENLPSSDSFSLDACDIFCYFDKAGRLCEVHHFFGSLTGGEAAGQPRALLYRPALVRCFTYRPDSCLAEEKDIAYDRNGEAPEQVGHISYSWQNGVLAEAESQGFSPDPSPLWEHFPFGSLSALKSTLLFHPNGQPAQLLTIQPSPPSFEKAEIALLENLYTWFPDGTLKEAYRRQTAPLLASHIQCSPSRDDTVYAPYVKKDTFFVSSVDSSGSVSNTGCDAYLCRDDRGLPFCLLTHTHAMGRALFDPSSQPEKDSRVVWYGFDENKKPLWEISFSDSLGPLPQFHFFYGEFEGLKDFSPCTGNALLHRWKGCTTLADLWDAELNALFSLLQPAPSSSVLPLPSHKISNTLRSNLLFPPELLDTCIKRLDAALKKTDLPNWEALKKARALLEDKAAEWNALLERLELIDPPAPSSPTSDFFAGLPGSLDEPQDPFDPFSLALEDLPNPFDSVPPNPDPHIPEELSNLLDPFPPPWPEPPAPPAPPPPSSKKPAQTSDDFI